MISVYDKDLRKIAVLQNAFDTMPDLKLNTVSTLAFKLPINDSKVSKCEFFNFVKYEESYYRILDHNESADYVEFQCEHAIATLIDDILFGYHIIGNLGVYTSEVIEYILSKQERPLWVLGQCDFKHQFEYKWENENLLNSLLSITTPFADSFRWEFDTTRKPWTINLFRVDESRRPDYYLMKGRNILNKEVKRGTQQICTRLYPLGAGEGVNQVNISSINNGKPYLDSPKDIMDKYGLVKKVWIDRRYENAESLMAAAESTLRELEKPYKEFSLDFVDFSLNARRTEGSNIEFKSMSIGDRVQLVDRKNGSKEDFTITGISTNCGNINKSKISIANKPRDIADTVAQIADRQRIEMTYSQGATQLYSQALQGNADSKEGLTMDFFIPPEMSIINRIMIKVRIGPFRAYSKSTSTSDSALVSSSSGGGEVTSTSSGGGVSKSTSSGGATVKSTSAGGGDTVTSGSSSTSSSTTAGQYEDEENNYPNHTGREYGEDTGYAIVTGMPEYSTTMADHFHFMSEYHKHTFPLPRHSHGINHNHSVGVKDHTHNITIENHTHDITIESHTHSVTIEDHTHDITIPGHGHEIDAGIYTFGSPSSFSIKVNDNIVMNCEDKTTEVDITSYLADKNKTIPRGSWMSIEIIPNDLSYISLDMFVQGFVQSRGDKTY